MHTPLVPPEATPKGDTSNQTRLNDGQGDVRGGILRVVAFVACTLVALACIATGVKSSAGGERAVYFSLGVLFTFIWLWLILGLLRRGYRRWRASRTLVLFHNRPASRRE